MKQPNEKLSRYALTNEVEARFCDIVARTDGSKPIVIFETPDGERHYVTEDEWRSGSSAFSKYAASKGIVTSESGTRDKVRLLRSLFAGRNDVFGRGFLKRDGRIGYAPACRHNSDWRVCPRKKTRNWKLSCADCSIRDLIALDDATIIAHLKGRAPDFSDVVGIYPFDKQCRTRFLAADFDGPGWQAEAAAYREAAVEIGAKVAIERSRSGNGGHAWTFFAEPIDAELARNLGCAIITQAMTRSTALSFSAYDRLFPTQSNIPKGGFGNLIALPLQGRAVKSGNSVFVDDNFRQYGDQWRYLSTIEKMSRDAIECAISNVDEGPLGLLGFGSKAEKTPRPQRACKQTAIALPIFNDHQDRKPVIFPASVQVIKANTLLVSKEGMSPAAQNKVRRLASMPNPEFYRAQAMRLSVSGKPRLLSFSEDIDGYIAIPRGCEQKLTKMLAEAGSRAIIIDHRNQHAPVLTSFRGELRPRQFKAAQELLKHEIGTLSAPTGFGKTVIGAYLIAELKMRTLVIVPSTTLIKQWADSLSRFIDIRDTREPLLTKSGKPSKRQPPLIGCIGGGHSRPGGLIDIATYQSLTSKAEENGVPREVNELVQNYDLVICDECHHGAAPVLERILRTANARRVYGLSATPRRKDGLEAIVFMQCGPILHTIDPRDQAAEQNFKRFLIPRFTRIRIKNPEREVPFNRIIDQLCEHEARNSLIVADVLAALERGRMPLVITQRREHAARLAERIQDAGKKAIVLTGSGSRQERDERLRQTRSIKPPDSIALVATGSYVGEGFDLPSLDTLFLAVPIASERLITQFSGRLHREHEGKLDVIVYDYVDTSIPILESMHRKRLKAYAKLAYEVITEDFGQAESESTIAGIEGCLSLLSADILRAEKSVSIAAPYAHISYVKKLLPSIEDATHRGVSVHITIASASRTNQQEETQTSIRLLEAAGCEVAPRQNHRGGIAVIDGERVWYGDLPLLGFANKESFSLRFSSCEIAYDLLEAQRAITQEMDGLPKP